MKLIETDRGIMIMGDEWDYKLRKMQMAWELALKTMPTGAQVQGKWTEALYLKNAQEVLSKSFEVVDAVFTEDKKN